MNSRVMVCYSVVEIAIGFINVISIVGSGIATGASPAVADSRRLPIRTEWIMCEESGTAASMGDYVPALDQRSISIRDRDLILI